MSVLTIYTNSYPYGNAETFLETEIPILSRHFSNVYIVPFKADGAPRNVPGNIRYFHQFRIKNGTFLKFIWSDFYHGI